MAASAYEELTDGALVEALRSADPEAPDLSDLLIEMWKRELGDALSYCRELMAANGDGRLNRHPDARLYDVLEVMQGTFGRAVDAEGWLDLASAYEERILDALMITAARRNPEIGYEVLAIAKERGNHDVINKALLSLTRSVPANDSNLLTCLMQWAQDRSVPPRARVALFERVGELPWSREAEDFLIQHHLDDDGSDPPITAAINEALKRCR